MKITFTHGIGIAAASFVMGLILFFLGFHSDLDKIPTGRLIGSIGSIAIMVGGIVMAMKARREEFAPEEGFDYGRALGTGTLTSLWAALGGAILTVLYATVINPGMQETIIEGEIAKMEANGEPANVIEQAEGIIRFMTSPAMMMVSNFIFAFIAGFIISLIIAALLKRAPVDVMPPLTDA